MELRDGSSHEDVALVDEVMPAQLTLLAHTQPSSTVTFYVSSVHLPKEIYQTWEDPVKEECFSGANDK